MNKYSQFGLKLLSLPGALTILLLILNKQNQPHLQLILIITAALVSRHLAGVGCHYNEWKYESNHMSNLNKH